MQWFSERFKIFVPLAFGVYLGFYVFGLVMGVFGFNELPVLHLIAAICLIGLGAYLYARHRGISPFAPDSPLARSQRNQRETRGF
jgi:hypothetical protein